MRQSWAAVLVAGLAGCVAQPAPPPVAVSGCLLGDETPQQEIMLYFGLTRPDGGVVDAAQWREFVGQIVTPRFPDGLTELSGDGQWRDRVSNRIGREPSRILLVIAQPAPDLGPRIEEIRAAYRTRFAQQSVGVVTRSVCAGF